MTSSISPKALDKIRKKYNLSSSSSISSSQFQEAQLLSQSSARKKQIFNFSFQYHIEVVGESTLIITLTGRHLSKNQYDPLPEFDRKNKCSKFHYKKAIKVASEECRLRQKGLLGSLKKGGLIPASLATVHFTFYNPVSRDHDNGSETIKRFQDTFTVLGLIVDDNRKHLSSERDPDEVIIGRNEEYKVVAVLKISRGV